MSEIRRLTGPIGAFSLSPPEKAAGGMPATWSVLRHTLGKMGVIRTIRTLTSVNQREGFDCPGCAWPDPQGHRHLLELCENGAKAIADEATTRRAGPEVFARLSLAELQGLSDHDLGGLGRLTHPLVFRRGDSHYRPIPWDEAFGLIGEALRGLESPDEALFYTSGRASNEAAFLWQLVARLYGTNNLPDCSNMCHESSGVGLVETVGVGKGTVTLKDVEDARLILIAGQNPGTNHPRMLTALQIAKAQGARIVAINPLKEPSLVRFKAPQELRGAFGKGVEIADRYLQVRIGGDVALFKGLAKALLAIEAERGGVIDRAMVEGQTLGFEAWAADIEATTWDEIALASGIERGAIEEVGGWLAETDRFVSCWAMGLTQHKNGVHNVQAISNLHLLRGALGKPGAGLCPVRGHSNVQGDRTMGINERPPPALLDRLAEVFGFEPPRADGHDVVGGIQAMLAGKAKVFLALGGNLASAGPDTARIAQAMAQCRLTVQISTKPNRSHLCPGEVSLILPCLGRTERDLQASGPQFVTVEDSMSVVHRSRGALPPPGPEVRSEIAVLAGIGRAALGERLDWAGLVADYDRIRDLIEQTIPGFERFNDRVRTPDGFVLPNVVRDERTFGTDDHKGRFVVCPIPRLDLGPGELRMMTIRTHDQYNTTVYALEDRYRGIHRERRVVLMNPADIAAQGFVVGDRVDLVGHFEGVRREAPDFVVVDYDVPLGQCATYFPEANVLVPLESFADRSRTPTSKSVVIRLSRRSA